MTKAEFIIEPKSNIFGIIGVIAAFLGLLSLLVGPAIRDAFIPPSPVNKLFAEVIVDLKQQITAGIKKIPAQPEAPQQHSFYQKLPDTLSLAFAALAIIGGSISYLRREDYRYTYVAYGLGTATLVWHTFLFALAAVVLCVILYYVLPDALS